MHVRIIITISDYKHDKTLCTNKNFRRDYKFLMPSASTTLE